MGREFTQEAVLAKRDVTVTAEDGRDFKVFAGTTVPAHLVAPYRVAVGELDALPPSTASTAAAYPTQADVVAALEAANTAVAQAQGAASGAEADKASAEARAAELEAELEQVKAAAVEGDRALEAEPELQTKAARVDELEAQVADLEAKAARADELEAELARVKAAGGEAAPAKRGGRPKAGEAKAQ